MLDKVKRLLIKWPIIIGYAAILALMGLIVCYWYYNRKSEITSTVVPVELERQSNIESLKAPKQAAEYFAYAIINEDLDQLMRVFPIDELCLKKNFVNLVNKEIQLSSDMTAPSREYSVYFPLTSAEIVGKYVDMYLDVKKEIQEIHDGTLETVNYLSPQKQLDSEFQLKMLGECEVYGADAFCDVEMVLKVNDALWSVPLRLVNYEGSWKVFGVGSSLQDKIEKKNSLGKTDLQAEKELTKKLQEFADETKETREKEESDENTETIRSGEALLPANYFVTNTVYEKSPEELMRKFLKYIQKKDLTSVLTLGNTDEEERELQNVTAEMLEKQREFAQKLQYFYYSFLIEGDLEKNLSLNSLEMTGTELLDRLNPELFFYLELREMIQKDKGQYLVYFKYEGEYFRYEIEFTQFSQGWQIKDIRDRMKLTEKEYLKEIARQK